MKKQLIIFGIIVLLITVGLSGCNESTTEKSSNDEYTFIGRWIDDVGLKWRFEIDKYYCYFESGYVEYIYEKQEGWEPQEGNLKSTWVELGKTIYIHYKFTNSDEVILYYDTGDTHTLQRQK